MPIKNITLDIIFEELTRILNSNQAFRIDKNLLIRIVTVQNPVGGVSYKRNFNLNEHLTRTRSVILI